MSVTLKLCFLQTQEQGPAWSPERKKAVGLTCLLPISWLPHAQSLEWNLGGWGQEYSWAPGEVCGA